MKYENFPKVKTIVEQIEKCEELMRGLSGDTVTVKVFDGSFVVMTIGAWATCEHSAREIAENFVSALKMYYSKRLEKLHVELSEL